MIGFHFHSELTPEPNVVIITRRATPNNLAGSARFHSRAPLLERRYDDADDAEWRATRDA